MTEADWLAAIPSLMMQHIKRQRPPSIRKLRLLAVAWARFLESLPDYANSKHVSHLGEAVLEGRQSLEQLWDQRIRGWGYDGDWSIAHLVLAPDDHIDNAIRNSMLFSEDRGRQAGLDVSNRYGVARSLIICVLSNPFRPVTLDPRWQTSTVVELAHTIYDHKAFERLPLLADALMDAGCDSEDILNHCRQQAEHVRGCWVVDLLTGRE